ncbi:MAG: hypothetical protein ACRDL5_01865 [Solirubrobacteraceae bacterium]
MSLTPSQLRRGELLAALGGAALVALLPTVDWFQRAGRAPDGWQALPGLRWLLLTAAAGGLALALAQTTCRAPALPSALDVVATVIGTAATIALAIRIATSAAAAGPGAWLGLAAAVALTIGAFASLRAEDGWLPGSERPIETLALDRPDGPRA